MKCTDGLLIQTLAAIKITLYVFPGTLRTPLMLACTKENVAVVETLVKSGASLDLVNKDGWTPFHIACRYCV